MSGDPWSMVVALVTHQGLPQLADHDYPLLPAQRRLSVTVQPAAWSDRTVAWGDFDAGVVRSTWDYPLRGDEFLEWADWAEVDYLGDRLQAARTGPSPT